MPRPPPLVRQLAFLLVFLAGVPGVAEGPLDLLSEKWRWRVFDRAEGLGSSSVSALHQDQYEYIYAGTERGLYRYDLWEWTALENARPFDDGPVLRFVESPGALYAATANALWRVQGGTSFEPLHRGKDLHAAAADLGDVYLIEGESGQHLQIRGEGAGRIDPEVRLPPGRILDYELDFARLHWLATSEGLFWRDLGQRAWRLVQERDLDEPLAGFHCFRFLRVGGPARVEAERPAIAPAAVPRELWALFRDPRQPGSTARLARLTEGAWVQQAALEGAPIRHLSLDAGRNYHATTDDGRLLFSPGGRQWTEVVNLGLGKVALHGGLLDTSGVLWFQTGTGGVASYDPLSRRWEPIPSGAVDPFPNVLSLVETEGGEVWLGMAKGVSRLRSSQRPEFFGKVQNLPLEKITGLGEDSLHRVWVSSAEAFGGAFYFDPDSESWVTESLDGFKEHPVRRIVRDRLGDLWFLSARRLADGGHVIYRSSLATAYDLSPLTITHGPVNDLVRARDDSLWVATDDGLLRGSADGETFRIDRRWTERDGLPSIQVWAVAEGPDGSIWICDPGSAAGVARLKDGAVVSYREAEGLASSEVWSIASAGPSVWFGTARGLSRFDGECWYGYPVASSESRSSRVWPILPSRRDPEAVLVGTFGLGALRFRMDDRRRPRFTRQAFPDRVKTGAAIAFEWDARDYRNQTPPESLLFRSRLDAGPWTPFSGARSARLASMAPGRHTLEVEVRDLAGNRNREGLVHRFEVGERFDLRLATAAAAILGTALALAIVGVAAARAIRARRRSGLFRSIFEAWPGPAFLVDAEGRVIDYNGVAPEVLGIQGARRKDIVGRPIQLLPVFYHEGLRSALRDLLRGEAVRSRGNCCAFEGGVERVLDARGYPLKGPNGGTAGAALFFEDRTRPAEEDRFLERERRLTSLRRLAGRLVEDLDGLFEAARGVHGENALPLIARLRGVEDVARRLSIFAGSDGVVRAGEDATAASVGSTIERLLGGGRLRAPGALKIDYRGQSGLWNAAIDETALEEALYEVLRNAHEAMPEKGTLTVRASNVQLGEDPGLLSPGSYVEVTVKDTGPGIDASQLDRLCEPFFSTKPRDRSLGVGLSVAYGLIRGRCGDVRIESRPGQGTTVRLLIPAARG